MQANRRNVYIEASSLTEPRTSGIGNTTLNIVRTFANDVSFQEEFQVQLIVPFNKAHFLDRYDLPRDIHIRKLWIPGKITNALTKLRLMPFVDLLFGKGVYLFPNYRNWPLIRSKSITYIHDMAHMRHPDFVEPKNLKYLNAHLGEWIARADRIVTVSDHAKAEINEFFPGAIGKTTTVYNGYDDTLFSEKVSALEVTEKHRVEPGRYFMFLSNIEPRKNIINLLEAFTIYRSRGGGQKLLIVGGMGWKNQDVTRRIEEINNTEQLVVRPDTFVPDEDLPGLLVGSSGLVHPAFYEGFGISPLQAMACGKHVVVGRNSSIPEVVGDAGIYVDVDDPADIADALERLEKLESQTNDTGIRRAREFTWDKTLVPLMSLIRECSKEI